ncbi:MAG: glucose-1-phosphate cytidylyltransferase [Clostridia bacterium]|nr:glucose-1-phosphate cytidylyltransferase [Clostridia bacterium]
MKVILLAGGLGSRITEESQYRPKPMVELGGMPILWHIMKEYSFYGFNDFIICAGYRQHMIKEWFADYFLRRSDVRFDFRNGKEEVEILDQRCEPWRVAIIDTGLNTMTGGRIKRIQPYVGEETFMMTYGDGVCDVDISRLLTFHRAHGKTATLTAVLPAQQKGVLDIGENNSVRAFREKQAADSAPINAGYMVLEPAIFDYLTGDDCVFEQEPLQKLAEMEELKSYKHHGFWQCMDNIREKEILEKMVVSGQAPWMKWEE